METAQVNLQHLNKRFGVQGQHTRNNQANLGKTSFFPNCIPWLSSTLSAQDANFGIYTLVKWILYFPVLFHFSVVFLSHDSYSKMAHFKLLLKNPRIASFKHRHQLNKRKSCSLNNWDIYLSQSQEDWGSCSTIPIVSGPSSLYNTWFLFVRWSISCETQDFHSKGEVVLELNIDPDVLQKRPTLKGLELRFWQWKIIL